jgi:hypothetical protein
MTSYVAQLRGRGSLPSAQANLARRDGKLSALSLGLAMILGAAVLATTGCAAQAGGLQTLPTARQAQAGELCGSVLGLDPAFRRYQDCAASLAQSAARIDQTQALQAARNACLEKGAGAGSGGLAECELKTAASAGPDLSARPGAPTATPVKSYAYASWREVRQREQLACARLGFEPLQRDFAECVASLDSALSASDHSAH